MDTNQCPRCKTRFRANIAICPVDGETLKRMQDPLLGRTIGGRYLIEEKIGGGGMGVVYRARHQVIARDVAIKFLHGRYISDQTSRKRFLGEARAANQINHENIIDITDFGETDDGLVYLVMEFLQGRSLDQEIAGRPLQPQRALHIAKQIAAGLARAHELDVIHRDVKPGNVFLVRRRSDSDSVKLLDFGIARFERELRITDRGTLLGTPEYIAPEQIRAGEVSPLTDLYALGCLLFEMLVGRPPFMGNMTEVLVKQMRELPPLASQLMPGLSPELDALLSKMLQKDPQQRHRDAFHVVDDLSAQLARLRGESPSETPTVRVDSNAPAALDSGAPPQQDSFRPTMHIPIERDEWADRVVQYRQMLTSTHPNSNIPAEVRASMEHMEHIVSSMAKLRGDLHGSAQQLTHSEDELRALRLRIGRALDELASDESKLRRVIESEELERDKAKDATGGAIDALLARPAIGPIALKRGTKLSDDDALLLQGLAMIVETVRDTHSYATKLTRQLEKRRVALEDLSFQIAQLKDRLATLNADSSLSQSSVQERVQTAEIKLRTELEQLVMEAERVALYLRTRTGKSV